ncbi:DUF1499 domain-containing protein [Vibrio navarrensis]
MKPAVLLTFCLCGLTACATGVTPMMDRTASPCGDKPNCVSTQENRDKFRLEPFVLKPQATLAQIEQVALQLPGAKSAQQQGNYLRIECTSRVFRFVDDLELTMDGKQLLVRSESRVGYSDFGVNRKRAEQLRALLQEAGLIE